MRKKKTVTVIYKKSIYLNINNAYNNCIITYNNFINNKLLLF